MRIIAGRFKGRRLRHPKGDAIRSTADRVKESLFNILAAEMPGAVVLDLFCGAGTLGMEALSRGAERVVFVDTSPAAIDCTRRNIALVDVADQVRIVRKDALRALRATREAGMQFDVIFADPPYGEKWTDKVLQAVAATGCLAEHGVLVIEHHRKEEPGPTPESFSFLTSRRFGDTVLSIWRCLSAQDMPAAEQGETV